MHEPVNQAADLPAQSIVDIQFNASACRGLPTPQIEKPHFSPVPLT
jgi:hypothetical protein